MERKWKNIRSGQATLEFTFGMVVAALLLMGMLQVMVWIGNDLAARRQAHERVLTSGQSGRHQVRPVFYYSTPISAATPSDIFGEPF